MTCDECLYADTIKRRETGNAYNLKIESVKNDFPNFTTIQKLTIKRPKNVMWLLVTLLLFWGLYDNKKIKSIPILIKKERTSSIH